MNIGESIKRLRLQNGLTQYQLGEYLNVSMQTVSRWETSATYPDIFMLPLLSKCFNVSIDHLLSNGERIMKVIESERFIIRDWNENDATELFKIEWKAYYLKFESKKDCLDIIKAWKEHQEMFPVILKGINKLVGIVGLVDINRYKGYCELEVHICDELNDVDHLTEIHKLFLNYGFNGMNLLIAFALCYDGDEILIQAMENVGFMYEGTLRKFGRDKRDAKRYSIMKNEFIMSIT